MTTESETARSRYEAKLLELGRKNVGIWSISVGGEENIGHAAQPWPRTAQPFGTGIGESWGFEILVLGSCEVGQTFLRTYDDTRWTIVFSELEKKGVGLFASQTVYWIAVQAEESASLDATARTSRDLANETVGAHLGAEAAALLPK